MGMRRYLVVLDMDLLAADEELDLEPISYLVAQQEREPCEAVVLSLANTRQAGCPPPSFFSARGCVVEPGFHGVGTHWIRGFTAF
jgi:hypothetical protein